MPGEHQSRMKLQHGFGCQILVMLDQYPYHLPENIDLYERVETLLCPVIFIQHKNRVEISSSWSVRVANKNILVRRIELESYPAYPSPSRMLLVEASNICASDCKTAP